MNHEHTSVDQSVTLAKGAAWFLHNIPALVDLMAYDFWDQLICTVQHKWKNCILIHCMVLVHSDFGALFKTLSLQQSEGVKRISFIPKIVSSMKVDRFFFFCWPWWRFYICEQHLTSRIFKSMMLLFFD